MRQAFYAASPFDLASDEDDLFRNAIDGVLDDWHYVDASVPKITK